MIKETGCLNCNMYAAIFQSACQLCQESHVHAAFTAGKGNAATGSSIVVFVAQENFQQPIYCIYITHFPDTEAGTNFSAQAAMIAEFPANPERRREVDGMLRTNPFTLPTLNAVLLMESYAGASAPTLGIVAKNAPERTSFKEDYGPYARPVLAAATFYVSYEGNGNQIVCSLQMIIPELILIAWIP
jgi:hypothetical protein